MTIGIGYGGDLQLWCTVDRRTADGTIHFDVINGCWDGKLAPDGKLTVKKTGRVIPGAEVLWEGKVPKEAGKGYNEAMKGIREQLAAPPAINGPDEGYAPWDYAPEQWERCLV